MTLSIGDIVTINVIEVSGYACWGIVDNYIGFVHCVEWSVEKPVPDDAVPKVGQQLIVKIFHVVDDLNKEIPADVSFDGKYRVDFAGSVRLLETETKE